MASGLETFEGAWLDSPLIRNAVKFGLGGAVLIFYATVLLHFGYTPDDTFIYLRFAKNIAQGNGFAFNPGEPTYGVTSPLWTLLLAAGGWLKLDFYLVAKVLDLIFASLALVVFYLLALEVIRERLIAFLATFTFSANVWFMRWSSTGMETSLAVLLVIVTVFYCMRNEYLIAAAASSLLTLVRPEGALLFLLIIVDIFFNSIEKRRAGRVVIASVLIYLAILVPWLLYAELELGTIVPNTAIAKGSLDMDTGGLASVTVVVGKTIATSSLLEFILMVSIVVLLIRRKEFSELRRHLVPLVWIPSLIVIYVGTEVDVVSRYLLLIIPFVTLYGFFGLKKVLEIIPRTARFGVSAALGFCAVILIQNQYVYQTRVKQHMVWFTDGVEECLTPIAVWLRDNTSDQSVVVAPDVGVIGYWCDRKVCDLAGLITPEMRQLRKQGLTYDEMMTKHLFIPICYPEYVVDRSPVPERLADEQFVPMLTRRFDGLALAKPGTQFYTLYKVRPGIVPKAELTHRAKDL